MELKSGLSESPKFSSPEEELDYLRQKIKEKEKELEGSHEQGLENIERDVAVHESLREYKVQKPEAVLEEGHALTDDAVESKALELAPEEHDAKIRELMKMTEEKGIKNTLSIIAKMKDPHIEDDFHRYLVQYVRKGWPVKGLKETTPMGKALKMTLYEVAVPERKKDDGQRSLKEVLSSMEQFFAGMMSVTPQGSSVKNHITLEIANANYSQEVVFYVSVPSAKKELFEKQILSVFEGAKLVEKVDDYNVFNEEGVSVGSYATLAQKPIFPLKTYDEFDHDPLNAILNGFSKIDHQGEGAAIQVVFRPVGESYTKKYKHALEQLQKGVPLKKAIDIPMNFQGEVFKFFKDIVVETAKSKKKEGEKEEPVHIDQTAIDEIRKKISSPIVEINLRIVASSKTPEEAEEILSNIESGFNQFENTSGNRIKFKRLSGGKLYQMFREFSFRTFSKDALMPLNVKETASFMHFHTTSLTSVSQLKQSRASTAPAPMDIGSEGVLLGVNRHRNLETKIHMAPEDRLRHFYNIGQTGTGKSTLLKNMIVQDIQNGDGVCMIDPHGSDIVDILANVPKERYEDVIYFDPSYSPRPMALNMLEYDRRYPEQKTFVVNEMLSIFNKLFDMKTAGGPMFEQYFRNAVLLVLEDPDSGNTLLDISKVLADENFRNLKLSKCGNPIVVQFWREVAGKAGGEASLANIVPYITSKFDVFLSNDIMRPIIGQQKSSLVFREIMDERKILLVNLSKGRLGDINANLIGLIIVGKILMAALSRVDSLGRDLPNFYLYIDEFQNITTDSIATILSEARKYKLSLNVAHQFIAQLEEKIKDAVFGNVGSIASFRVSAEDSEYLESQFEPVFTASDLMNLDNRNGYVKMLVNGRPARPFNIETLPPPKGNPEVVEKLKQLSYLKYGKDRVEIEAEISKKYNK